MREVEAAAEEKRAERETEERRLQAEREAATEERRLQAEREAAAEEKKAEREAEERRAEREAEERKLLAECEAEERKAAMELERLKLELEAKRLETTARPAGIAEEVVRRSARMARSPELPAFVDGRDDLDNYLLRFERYATVAGWKKEGWATQLSPLLSGRALEVYSRLSQDEAMDYQRLKLALLKRYDFTEFGYRRRFHDAKPEGQESPGQFIVRLQNYLTKWVKLAKVEESFDGVVELMVREQFTNACPKELSVYLNERSPKTLDELVTWAEQYLMAHNKKLSSSQSRREDVKNGSRGGNLDRPRARCGVSDVVAKDIVPQNAYPGCQMVVAERERDTKGDFHARSVTAMGMKPEIVALRRAITMRSVLDQT